MLHLLNYNCVCLCILQLSSSLSWWQGTSVQHMEPTVPVDRKPLAPAWSWEMFWRNHPKNAWFEWQQSLISTVHSIIFMGWLSHSHMAGEARLRWPEVWIRLGNIWSSLRQCYGCLGKTAGTTGVEFGMTQIFSACRVGCESEDSWKEEVNQPHALLEAGVSVAARPKFLIGCGFVCQRHKRESVWSKC